jgi:acyl carrier protein
MDKIEARVVSIAAEYLKVPEDSVSVSSSFIADLGADTLDIVDFVMALEDKFGITIAEADCENMETVGDAVRVVRSLVGK